MKLTKRQLRRIIREASGWDAPPQSPATTEHLGEELIDALMNSDEEMIDVIETQLKSRGREGHKELERSHGIYNFRTGNW